MKQFRDDSARDGEPLRWFVYLFASILAWIALMLIGNNATLVVACVSIAVWLWWVSPKIGVNQRPMTWLLTILLIVGNAAAVLLALFPKF
jgi:hypothetical protein